MDAPPFDRSRAAAVGRALSQVPESVYEAIDRGEPEWPVLTVVSRLPSPYNILTGFALALSDDQLGPGGARQYWKDVADELARRDPLQSRADLERLMRDVMQRPVAARSAPTKLDRVRRLLGSSLPSWLGTRVIEDVGRECLELWTRLAEVMGQSRDAKSMVFGMKVFELQHKIATGHYVSFPTPVPIVADMRIGRLSLSSGLVPIAGRSVVRAMADMSRACAAPDGGRILSAWAQVAQHAGGLSLFRIDSLAWQLAEPIYRQRYHRIAATRAAAAILRDYGCTATVAGAVADEMTYAL